MVYYSQNTVRGSYHFHRTPEQIEEARKLYGDIPEGDLFKFSYRDVLKWGTPWWRIHDILYDRNARKDNLSDADDFLTWKALLYTLAETLKFYYLPLRMVGVTCKRQWREDIFSDAATALWKLVVAARGKLVSAKNLAWISITRACRDSGVQKVPANFDVDRFLATWVDRSIAEDPSDTVERELDSETLRHKSDAAFKISISKRVQVMHIVSLASALAHISRGTYCKPSVRSVVELHKRMTAHEVRRRYEEAY